MNLPLFTNPNPSSNSLIRRETVSRLVPMEWAINGLLFCTVVGLVFGVWPALKASRLPPIEALRWE